MKRFFLRFIYLSLFVFSAIPVFSQMYVINSEWMNCTYALQSSTGRVITSTVSHGFINEYNDGTFQIVIYYNNGTPTEYISLYDMENFGTHVVYEAVISNDAGARFFDITAIISGTETTLQLILRQGARELGIFHFTN